MKRLAFAAAVVLAITACAKKDAATVDTAPPAMAPAPAPATTDTGAAAATPTTDTTKKDTTAAKKP